jgi:hypothetical protein
MSVFRSVIFSLICRSFFAAPCFWGSWYLLHSAAIDISDIVQILAGLVLSLVGIAIMAPPVVTLIAEPTGNMFYPGQRYDKRQPVFSVPQALRRKGEYAEALSMYQKLVEDDPRDIRPYIEMINIAIMDLNDVGLADSIVKRGGWSLGYRDKQALKEMCAAIKSRQDVRSAKPGTVAYKHMDKKIARSRAGMFKISREE